jgi:hypothetical protein
MSGLPDIGPFQWLHLRNVSRRRPQPSLIDNEFHVAGGSFQSDGMPGIFSQMATHEVFPVGK